MATRKPRVNVVLNESLYKIIKDIAEKEEMSISSTVQDLVKEALELREDISLAEFADKRKQTFDKSKALSHKEVWE